jgi:pimeloyl-ACP methyl ester carboxylesterase
LWLEPFSILSQDWRCIAYDHRGSGATLAPIESITFNQLVDDFFVILDEFSVESCILADESAGVMTALAAARRDPQRIRGLVLVDGLVHRAILPENDRFLASLKANYPATLDWFVETCVPEPDSESIKRWGRQIIDRASKEAAIALYLSANKVDLRDELSLIQQPTLILHGELDALCSLDDARWLNGLLPNSKLVMLPGAGHVPTLTRPQEIAAQILEFFSL